MRKNKKSAVKVFTFLLCLSLLTGCSSGGNDNKKDDNTQVTATEAPAGTGSEKEEDGKNDKPEDENKDNNTDPDGNTGDVTPT